MGQPVAACTLQPFDHEGMHVAGAAASEAAGVLLGQVVDDEVGISRVDQCRELPGIDMQHGAFGRQRPVVRKLPSRRLPFTTAWKPDIGVRWKEHVHLRGPEHVGERFKNAGVGKAQDQAQVIHLYMQARAKVMPQRVHGATAAKKAAHRPPTTKLRKLLQLGAQHGWVVRVQFKQPGCDAVEFGQLGPGIE